MNLSIHLALTLNYLWGIPISFFYVMSLSSLLVSYSKIKISKLIANPGSEYLEDSSDQRKKHVCNCQQSCFFYSNPKNASDFIHRSSIQHWIKRDEMPIFPINGSNHLSIWVLYTEKFANYSFWTHLCINIVVERVPCCVWTSNGLALTMLMVPHCWLIENQSKVDLPTNYEMLWFFHMIS